MTSFTPYSALLGGGIIATSVIILLLFNGRTAGISGIMHELLPPHYTHYGWRIAFLLGLVLGGFVFQLFSDDYAPPRQDSPLWLIGLGGFLVGIGSRYGSGCTSGHGVCGLASFSKRSLFATLTFMGFGGLSVFVIKHIIG